MSTGREHAYAVGLEWTGNRGDGTATYAGYGREHVLRAGDKPPLAGSADPLFRGDADRWNPEDLLVGALSGCHMLWYLALAAKAKLVVVDYRDAADGVMVEAADGGGEFTRVTLRPRVTLAPGGDAAEAERLHVEAHRLCYVARSVNFPVAVEPTIVVA